MHVVFRFRHPNIVELLGFSEGGGGLMCLIYSYMENRSLEDQLHKVTPSHARLSVMLLVAATVGCNGNGRGKRLGQ